MLVAAHEIDLVPLMDQNLKFENHCKSSVVSLFGLPRHTLLQIITQNPDIAAFPKNIFIKKQKPYSLI